MIDKYITFLTFIPWILIFIISMINNLNNKDYLNFNFDYVKNNLFKIFRLDTLFLIIVFFYFASYDKIFVDKYLFAVMTFYLFVNSFYEKKDSKSKSFFKNNIIKIFLLLIVLLIPFLVYFIKNDLVLTYKIMFILLFIEYLIVLVINYISKYIIKIFRKN